MTDKNPLSLGSSNFDVDAYMSELLKRKGLDELIALDEQMIFSVRKLDCEMQQLVYENYNKFLTAVGTVKLMKKEFSSIDEQMASLSSSISNISKSTKHLCNVFGSHRESVRQLTEQNKTVKSLQCIFTLPNMLQKLIDAKEYTEAVNKYLSVKEKLENFKEHKSIIKIFDETNGCVHELEELLKAKLMSRVISEEEFVEVAKLLEKLGVNTLLFSNDIFKVYKERLLSELGNLEAQVNSNTVYFDVLEFVDENGVCSILNSLSTMKTLFSQLFRNNEGHVIEFADEVMNRLMETVLQKFLLEKETNDSVILVRALDRVYRRLLQLSSPPVSLSYTPLINSVIEQVAINQIEINRTYLCESFDKSLLEMRNDLTYLSNVSDYPNILNHWESNFLMTVKNILANLSLFVSSDITFISARENNPTNNRLLSNFGSQVKDKVLIMYIDELCALVNNYLCGKDEKVSNVSPVFYILFAKFLLNLKEKHLDYLLDICYDLFRFEDKDKCTMIERKRIEILIQSKCELILQKFVSIHGSVMSSLIVNSIESKDWLNCPESRGESRSVVKRLIEQFLELNEQIKSFVVVNDKTDHSNDSYRSSRKHLDSKFDGLSRTSALDKLFAEKVDLFAAVEFKKNSILTAVINIFMKSIMEVVRLKHFSKNGYNQMQVDCISLKNFFLKFVVHPEQLDCYIDEILNTVRSRSNIPAATATPSNPFTSTNPFE
uniref:Vacuolar protein sorting-associated protein 51 homolog n=1 Tax=Rhabditophanes sp. KR3021 TaxID=114890 RepID=A0AC35U9G4_9BILA